MRKRGLAMTEPWGGPGFEPYEGPNQHEFAMPDSKAHDLGTFLREEFRRIRSNQTAPPPAVDLPNGCRWQLGSNNRWSLLVPAGRAGFLQYEGEVEDLIGLARQLEPMD